MSAEHLLKHFDRLSEAPDAISRFRQLILELAIRGKLVEQDPSDEDAKELLSRVQAEKIRLTQDQIIRKSVRLPIIQPSEMPFETPKNWVWTRLGEVGDWGSGSTPPRDNSGFYGGDITWLKSGELNDNLALRGSHEKVTKLALEQCPFRFNQIGDVLIAMYGATMGKLAILAEPAVTNQAVCGCTPIKGVFNKYLYLYLLSRRDDLRSRGGGGAQPNISKEKIIFSPFILPPFLEQQRIAAKVDELMALCTQLENAKNKREKTQNQLVSSSLNQLTTLSKIQDTETKTKHSLTDFFFTNLSRLMIQPTYVKQLRQAIFELAIRGKLVSQDPNNGSGGQLLKQIQEEKTRLIKDKLVKKEPLLPVISSSETPFRIPENWTWTRLGEIGEWGSGTTPSRENSEYYGGNITWLKSGELNDNPALRKSEEKLTQVALEKHSFRLNQAGDVLIAMYGATIGRLAILAEPAVTNQAVCGCTPMEGIFNKYLFLYLYARRESLRSQSEGGAQPNISKIKIVTSPFALPPLLEQHRIVAKVDELMVFCDQLETRLDTIEAGSRQLLDAMFYSAFGISKIRSNKQLYKLSKGKSKAQQVENLSPQEQGVSTNNLQFSTSNPVKTINQIIECLHFLGGSSTPEHLLNLTGLGGSMNNTEKFFDLLREGRDSNFLVLATGANQLIRLIQHAN